MQPHFYNNKSKTNMEKICSYKICKFERNNTHENEIEAKVIRCKRNVTDQQVLKKKEI